MNTSKHLVWIVFGAFVGFAVSFIFSDLFTLPLDLYYLIYFGIILGFFTIYIKRTQLDLKTWIFRRLGWGILLGGVVAVIMVKNVLSRPATEQFSGGYLLWEIVWRGLIYGAIDGLLLTVFPWVVTWRAFDVETKPLVKKIGFGLVAWLLIIMMTTAYHVGYSDFRSKKVIQANIGNTLMSVPTLVAANPMGATIAHAALHISAVIHSPKTELFLPPHREQPDAKESL
jgi:hypothetical protein